MHLPFKPIHAQSGEGFVDTLKSGYEYVKKGVQRVRDVLAGVRKHAPPSVRAWLEKFGDEEVVELKICRRPIMSMIEKMANLLSNGQLDKNKEKLSYDKLMHLFMLIELVPDDSGVPRVYLVEKNQVVRIEKAKWETDAEEMKFQVSSEFTMNKRFAKAEQTVGTARLFVYDAKKANCQYFIKWLLQGTSGWNASVEKFVMQDIEKALEGMGILEKAAKVVTDVGNVVDVAMNGAGARRRGRGGRR
jgi:hypothetical protein